MKRHYLGLTFLALVMALLFRLSLPLAGDESGSGHIYCSTANPLGLVYIDLATEKEKRLFSDPVWQLISGPRSWVAALRNGDRIEVFKDGKLIRLLRLKGTDNRLVGWTNDKLLYETPQGLHALDIANGSTQSLKHLQDAIAAYPAGASWVIVRKAHRELKVELYRGSEANPVLMWKADLPGSYIRGGVVIDNRYFAIRTAEYDDKGNYVKDGFVVFDLVEKKRAEIPVSGSYYGISQGRSSDEILILSSVDSKPGVIEVEAVDLPEMSRKELMTVRVKDADLQGLTADNKWLLMYTTYPNTGPGRPGKVFAVRLRDGYRRAVRENVYECVVVR